MAVQGAASQGKAWRGRSNHYMTETAEHDEVRQDGAGQDGERYGKTGQGTSRRDKT